MRERKRNWAQLSQTFKLYSPAKTKPNLPRTTEHSVKLIAGSRCGPRCYVEHLVADIRKEAMNRSRATCDVESSVLGQRVGRVQTRGLP